MHQPTCGDRAHFPVRRLGRQPEIVIGIVMRQREGTGQLSTETVTPDPDAPVMWIRVVSMRNCTQPHETWEWPALAHRVEQECGHDRFASGADVPAALVTRAGHLDRRLLSSKRPTFRSFRRQCKLN